MVIKCVDRVPIPERNKYSYCYGVVEFYDDLILSSTLTYSLYSWMANILATVVIIFVSAFTLSLTCTHKHCIHLMTCTATAQQHFEDLAQEANVEESIEMLAVSILLLHNNCDRVWERVHVCAESELPNVLLVYIFETSKVGLESHFKLHLKPRVWAFI